MATYKFDQFNVEIVDPTVTPTINISVTLETADAKLYGVNLTDIRLEDLSSESQQNILNSIDQNLQNYEL